MSHFEDKELVPPPRPDIAPPRVCSPSAPALHIRNNGCDGQSDGDNELLSSQEVVDEETQAMAQRMLDNFGKPYSFEDERPPNLPAYHPSFAIVLNDCAEIFRKAASLLQISDYKDKHTQKLLSSISDKRDIQYDRPKRVGVIGGSGVGE